MKTLIIVVHPNLHTSAVNKRWIEVLQQHPSKYDVHMLHDKYPSEMIDVAFEQQLVEAYDTIVFQFPFYWFNSPPLLKKWLDEVLTYGWAYGSKSGYKLAGKKIALAISAGIDEHEYSTTGKYKYSMETLTTPFELTFDYVRAQYKGIFVHYGVELNPSAEWVEESVAPYLQFLDGLQEGHHSS
ncbi:putative NADPH-quinone reductase [Chitinophaga skermanii]|uniref:Putative NADPH-quinone reductase n=1 Tax=Chitinophaga skermanii TaxID=331697 RepID=A0A327QVS4_9BACT|nr:NAD(P)H-dependent oxidoreductase [Chitinophaga skermanii]RAJ08689.1 putative NADPH-quinone reductase [Chitinophaga skermanii]